MPMPWEENPRVQRAQALTILGLLAVLTVVTLIDGLLSGEWRPLAIVGLVWLALVVVHLGLGLVFRLLVTLAGRRGKRR